MSKSCVPLRSPTRALQQPSFTIDRVPVLWCSASWHLQHLAAELPRELSARALAAAALACALAAVPSSTLAIVSSSYLMSVASHARAVDSGSTVQANSSHPSAGARRAKGALWQGSSAFAHGHRPSLSLAGSCRLGLCLGGDSFGLCLRRHAGSATQSPMGGTLSGTACVDSTCPLAWLVAQPTFPAGWWLHLLVATGGGSEGRRVPYGKAPPPLPKPLA